MKKSRIIILILSLSLILFSCTKESFSLSSSVLTRNITVMPSSRTEEAVLRVALEEDGDSDAVYTFLLVSPDGDLRWEGKLEKSGEYYYSPSLGITPGASFTDGEYSLYVYSSLGTTVDEKVTISKEEGNYTYGNASSKDSASVVFYDREEFVTDTLEDADYAVITYRDRYSNSITLRVEFNL